MTDYKRVWRNWQDRDGRGYSLFVVNNDAKNKASVSAIESEKQPSGVEVTQSAFVKYENGRVFVEMWQGNVSEDIKQYTRVFSGVAPRDTGELFIEECYTNAIRIQSNTPYVAKLCDNVIEYVRMIEKKTPKKQEAIHDTYP